MKPRIKIDLSQVEDIELDGIDHADYPDFSDAYIASATYMGRDMTDEELDVLNENSDLVYDCVINRLF